MKKRTTLDFSGYRATDLEMAISLGVAHDLLQGIDPRNMTSIAMAISNAFLTGVAYLRNEPSAARKKELEKEYADVIRRIRETGNGQTNYS